MKTTICWVGCDFIAISFLAARQSVCLGRLTYYSKWNEPASNPLVLIKSQAQSKDGR